MGNDVTFPYGIMCLKYVTEKGAKTRKWLETGLITTDGTHFFCMLCIMGKRRELGIGCVKFLGGTSHTCGTGVLPPSGVPSAY